MVPLIIYFYTFILSSFLTPPSTSSSASNDSAVMSKLLVSFNSTAPSDWSNTTNYCEWTNILCDESGRVTDITLINQSLSGTLPPDLGTSLTKLTTLSLQGNSLTGQIPSFANLTSLEQLYLDNNNFSSIHSGFFQGLTYGLQTLTLSVNPNLKHWTIPAELSRASTLVTFYASDANIIGSLPDIFGGFQFLKDLRLSFNDLTGTLPKFLGAARLVYLYLDHNNLTGPIPDALTNIRKLKVLDVSYNNLSGSIPKFGDYVHLNTSHNHLIPNNGNTAVGTWSSGTPVSPRLV